MTQPTRSPHAATDPATDPVTDVNRLLEISRYDLESPPVRAALDRFAHEAATRLDLPIGLVTIVLDGAQFLAGAYGIDHTWLAEAGGTPVEWSFCATTVRTRETYVVEDADTDPAQLDNPLVTLDGLLSYAGAPLVTPSGHVLGACCTLGYQARAFAPDDLEVLRELSTRIMETLEEYAVSPVLPGR